MEIASNLWLRHLTLFRENSSVIHLGSLDNAARPRYLLVVNSDHDAASRREELARKLGKGWIDGLLNRYHVPANQLIDVQITLFELIWSGTIRQLRGSPTRNAGDPEHKEFGQFLDQLDSSLQEVIARSRRPRFTLSFYGMVKAGKSLFLNALIGKVVLPSNGRALGIAYLVVLTFMSPRATINRVALSFGSRQRASAARTLC